MVGRCWMELSSIAPRSVRRWIKDILALAVAAGTDLRPLARAIDTGRLDPSSLLEAAVAHDAERFDDLARVQPDYRGTLRGLAQLIATPMLRACERAWASHVPPTWAHGYCPICGGRPALAESRDRVAIRWLRCSSCGSDWPFAEGRCPFCADDDAQNLGGLMSPDTLHRQRVDACDRCGGYLKTLTSGSATRSEDVILRDLATFELDMAAIERGYRRAASGKHHLTLRRHRSPWRAVLTA
jgi:FdhE protein